jgi:hypothetical protein
MEDPLGEEGAGGAPLVQQLADVKQQLEEAPTVLQYAAGLQRLLQLLRSGEAVQAGLTPDFLRIAIVASKHVVFRWVPRLAGSSATCAAPACTLQPPARAPQQ